MPVATTAADPPIASPIALDLVITHPPAASEVRDALSGCAPRGESAGTPRDGVSEVVSVGPIGAAAIYPTGRRGDDHETTVLTIAPDGTAHAPATLTVRGLLSRMEPLAAGFVVVTNHADFTVGLVTRFHVYVIDGEGRFGGHLEITADGRSQLDGIGSGGAGTLRFFFAPNPSQQGTMVVVEVRREASGALTRSEVSVPVHAPEIGAPGRSMVVALPPSEAMLALVLHPDAAPELLRGTTVTPVPALDAVRGSWLLGNPVRAVVTDEGTRLHVAGDGGGLFVLDDEGVHPVAGTAEIATTLGVQEPVEVAIVGGELQLGDLAQQMADAGELAWSGTTVAQLAGPRLAVLDCAR